MFLPGRPFCDPSFQNVLLRVCQHLVRTFRRHPQSWIGLSDALIDKAGLQVTGNHRRAVLALRKHAFPRVEAQIGHACVGVRAMAVETVFRQDGPHHTLKIDLGARGCRFLCPENLREETAEQDDQTLYAKSHTENLKENLDMV